MASWNEQSQTNPNRLTEAGRWLAIGSLAVIAFLVGDKMLRHPDQGRSRLPEINRSSFLVPGTVINGPDGKVIVKADGQGGVRLVALDTDPAAQALLGVEKTGHVSSNR